MSEKYSDYWKEVITLEYFCEGCGHKIEKTDKRSVLRVWLKEDCAECGHHEFRTARETVSPVIDPFNAGRVRQNSDFRNKLEKIKKDYRGSKINEHGMDR